MKKIGEPTYFEGPDAWGGNGNHWRQVYEIEREDVGQRRENYGGRDQPGVVITFGDVGRQFTSYSGQEFWTWNK